MIVQPPATIPDDLFDSNTNALIKTLSASYYKHMEVSNSFDRFDPLSLSLLILILVI